MNVLGNIVGLLIFAVFFVFVVHLTGIYEFEFLSRLLGDS